MFSNLLEAIGDRLEDAKVLASGKVTVFEERGTGEAYTLTRPHVIYADVYQAAGGYDWKIVSQKKAEGGLLVTLVAK